MPFGIDKNYLPYSGIPTIPSRQDYVFDAILPNSNHVYTMRLQEEYERLRDEFLSVVQRHVNDNILIELKNSYADIIDSRRKLSRIKNLESLINVLETRDALSYENIEPFQYISKKFNVESTLQVRLADYAQRLQFEHHSQLYNMYMSDNGEYPIQNTCSRLFFARSDALDITRGNRYVRYNDYNNVEEENPLNVHVTTEQLRTEITNSENDTFSRRKNVPEENTVQEKDCLTICQDNLGCNKTLSRQKNFLCFRLLLKLIILGIIACVIIIVTLRAQIRSAALARRPVPNATSGRMPILDPLTATSSGTELRTGLPSRTIVSPSGPIDSRNTNQINRQEQPVVATSSVLSNREVILQQMVLQHVSERLGRSWRDVARLLNVRECEIDVIQQKYPNSMQEQSYEALKEALSKYDSNQWRIYLMKALEKGRRKDLRDTVEDLVYKNT